jgi:DNA polymerase-1
MTINITPTTKDAYRLFHDGSLALAEAEFNGIRADREYIQRTIANLKRQEKRLRGKLNETELGRLFKATYGRKANYDSDQQLREILYGEMGLPSTKKTSGGKKGSEAGKASVDSETLESLDRSDVKLLLQMRTIDKMSNTYLKNLLLESEADGYIHPFFHLAGYSREKAGGARSLRSSSSDPNFQNLPNRHEDERKLIRQAFLPRPGHRLVGRDYGSMEFRISACLHQDPNMIRYIEKGDDPHRDVAAKCFMLPPTQCTKQYGTIGKNIRHVGKNGFTFAQMYFQDPPNTAAGMWKGIRDMDLRVPTDPDKSLLEHLKDKGIRNYGAFEEHIVKKVCPWFWEGMFPVYGKWRPKWLSDYNKNGYFDMLTGFRIEGVMTKYQLGNYPVQGPSFHILLKSLIKVHDLWKSKSGWKSKIVGQIHDELTTDEEEQEFYRNQDEVVKIMEVDVRKDWPWIIVPLDVSTSATPVDGNWYLKKSVE